MLIVILNLVGAFGRGYLATEHLRAADGSLEVKYERIERFRTASILTVQFGAGAIRQGNAQLWVSESLAKRLGNQRVVPNRLHR